VPSEEAEDGRQLHRELESLKEERTQHINRIKGLLASQGIRLELESDFPRHLDTIRLWDGSPLPEDLQGRLGREFERLQFVAQQITDLEHRRLESLRHSTRPEVEKARTLLRVKGIGVCGAWLYTMEFFAWRGIRNRRELGALAGLTPTPHQSGDASRELGISKCGNRHVRTIAIQLAWGWLRYQPNSKLTKWYQERFGEGGSRVRRIGIVALARRLLIDLWRYTETGVIPEGAELKTGLI
jgi:transposase